MQKPLCNFIWCICEYDLFIFYLGPQTGTCNLQTKTCNVLAWCPVEAERKER